MRKGTCIGMTRVLGVLGVLVTGTAIADERPEEIRELRQRLRAARQEGLFAPLASETVGARPVPQVVTPPGSYALSIDGDFALGGFIFKDGYPFLHNDGGYAYGNTALGLNALVSSTPGVPDYFSGINNTALGDSALRNNTEGRFNTASGYGALYTNTTGRFNTASGDRALFSNTTGSYNTASGGKALASNTTGYRNIALGIFAGQLNTTGSSNIWIGNYGVSPGTEANTLRIGRGTGTTFSQQNRAFISGIRDITTDVSDAITVLIDSDGQLGTVNSSRRVKEDIRDMGEASSGLQRLRPVTFRYKKAFADGDKPIRYGLIAEEVAEVFPELVAYDEEGQPEAVLYHLLDAMFLNELQKQQRLNATQEAELVELRATKARVEEQDTMLRELRARLTRLEVTETARGRPVKIARR